MPRQGAVPDAWDDDWESLADKQDDPTSGPQDIMPAKLSKSERKAQHAELNRQIWETAEAPEPIFLQARENAPMQSTFKPAVKVLSRKPPPQILSRNGTASGMGTLKLEDDDDSEEERRKKAEESFAERQARAQKERAEKQRKYAEARERLFGSPAPSSSESRGASPNKQNRSKGRGRGGRDSQPRSSNEQSPSRPAASGKLYDPSYTPKPNSTYFHSREVNGSRPQTPNELQHPTREPRGPPSIGEKGFASRQDTRSYV